MKRLVRLVFLLFLLAGAAQAQQRPFDVSAYQAFLDAHTDLDAATLRAMHDAGVFRQQAPLRLAEARYGNDLAGYFALTDYERGLVERHGFMVSERLAPYSLGDAFREVYANDLPVFVSTDAILHAWHMSYDRILMDAELEVLVPRLQAILRALHATLPELAQRYPEAGMQTPLRDLDAYLTVARVLLDGAAAPVFAESQPTVDDLLALVEAETMADYPLFAEGCRRMDFSQFTVRGHYTQDPALARYFQAMMWLGRTELYLITPETDVCRPGDADVQRQTLMTLLLAEAAEGSEAGALLETFDAVLQLFVGEPDNVTLGHLRTLRAATGVGRAADLLDEARWRAFQATLAEQAWAIQRIQSQILVNNTPMQPGRLKPAAAFLLLGQRFVIDSYVTGSVVYDKIAYRGQAVKRMLPSTLDVLFALGNDAAAQMLEADLQRYPYAANLAALRYLVDSYEPAFWQSSLYNGWLDAIRALNPPRERTALPAFMQTAAWWQQKANTQLAAWAQLRHDNLLYAKQSYTGVPGCSFPYSYVEPIPAFYEAVGRLARTASTGLQSVDLGRLDVRAITDYFARVEGVADTLAAVAHKELDGTPLSEAEAGFLGRMLFKFNAGCYEEIDGWYPRLFYAYEKDPGVASKQDLVVADVHTAPADAGGNYVGWVLHVGTGPLNMAVVAAEVPGAGLVAFAGPVMSYYEHLSTGFERLTDEVWQTAFAVAPSVRPDFVNLYLAGQDGASRGEGFALATGIEDPEPPEVPRVLRLAQPYPNPFSAFTAIGFTVTPAKAHAYVELDVYDVRGRRVRRLLSEALPAGHYTVRWDGQTDAGTGAASGVYLCRLRIGEEQATGTMTLVR